MNVHAQHVVNENMKKVKSYYSDIEMARSISFKPFVSIIGIGTLGNNLGDVEQDKNRDEFISRKLGKIMLNDRRKFFDENEMFETDGVKRDFKAWVQC